MWLTGNSCSPYALFFHPYRTDEHVTDFLGLMATMTVKEKSEPFSQAAFKVFDRDSFGTMLVAELYALMRALDETLTEAEIQDLIDRAGLLGKNEITYDGKHDIWQALGCVSQILNADETMNRILQAHSDDG